MVFEFEKVGDEERDPERAFQECFSDCMEECMEDCMAASTGMCEEECSDIEDPEEQMECIDECLIDAEDECAEDCEDQCEERCEDEIQESPRELGGVTVFLNSLRRRRVSLRFMRLTATNALVAINTLVYIAELASPKIVIYGALVPALVFERPRTLITYAFLHANFLHLFFNMIFLWVLGNRLEEVIGQESFIVAYLTIAFLVGIIHAILCLTILTPYAYVPAIGASGAVMGVLGMSVVHIGDLRLRIILFPIPIPLELTVRNLAILIFVTETFMALLNIEPGIAHDAHIAGLILGYFMARFSKPSLSIPLPQKKGFSLELLRGKERPRYVWEFTLYDEMDIACIRRLSYHLYRLLNGKPVNVNEILADITQCDPEALELFVVSTLTSLRSPTQRTLIGMLIVSILKILVRAYDEGVVDVSFRKLRVFRSWKTRLITSMYVVVERRGYGAGY